MTTTSSSVAVSELLESLGYAYFEVDLAGGLLYGNNLFYDAVGYRPEELLGKHFRHYVDRKQVATIYNIFSMIYRTEMPEQKLPLDFRHKDGTLRTAEGSVSLIRDEQGAPIGFRALLAEITARKQEENTVMLARRKAEREIEVAREIQNSFLVKDYPQPDGWEIAARIRPARHVSGDFYDIFPVTASKQIALIMADVCDKGVGAAMYMAIFRTLLRAFSDQQYVLRWAGVPVQDAADSPSTVFRRDLALASGVPSLKNAIELTNNYIAVQHESSNMFATVFFGLLSPADGTLHYINAGHEEPLILANGAVKARLAPTGPAVGMLPNSAFRVERTTIAPGESLLLYTDGVADALNAQDQRFSEERMLAAAVQNASSAGGLLGSIFSALGAHMATTEQYDDITMMAVRRAA
jgi:sigma-B regulation protein RsbU (phosphoserine phosphatase)